MITDRFDWMARGVLLVGLIMLGGCAGLVPHDTSSLLLPPVFTV